MTPTNEIVTLSQNRVVGGHACSNHHAGGDANTDAEQHGLCEDDAFDDADTDTYAFADADGDSVTDSRRVAVLIGERLILQQLGAVDDVNTFPFGVSEYECLTNRRRHSNQINVIHFNSYEYTELDV